MMPQYLYAKEVCFYLTFVQFIAVDRHYIFNAGVYRSGIPRSRLEDSDLNTVFLLLVKPVLNIVKKIFTCD